MNKQKTKALGLGNWKNRSHWPLPWLEAVSTLSLLGINFSSSIRKTASRLRDSAYGQLLGQLEPNIQLKSFLALKNLFSKISSAIVNYIWFGKLKKTQRSVLYRKALRDIKIRENMFLFNQRLLPTRVRFQRLDNTTDMTCALCQQATESDEHIMLQYPSREFQRIVGEDTEIPRLQYHPDGVHQRTDMTCQKQKKVFCARGCLRLHNVEGEDGKPNTSCSGDRE